MVVKLFLDKAEADSSRKADKVQPEVELHTFRKVAKLYQVRSEVEARTFRKAVNRQV